MIKRPEGTARCQAIGCKAAATKFQRDSLGRKSYRCEAHYRKLVPAGVCVGKPK